jgi:hypothetical protein
LQNGACFWSANNALFQVGFNLLQFLAIVVGLSLQLNFLLSDGFFLLIKRGEGRLTSRSILGDLFLGDGDILCTGIQTCPGTF